MKLEFDLESVQAVEFGVGLDGGDGQTFRLITVDGGIQTALLDMVKATWDGMLDQAGDGPPRFEPSEKYDTTEYVYLPLDDQLATSMRALHQAVNLPVDGTALSDPAKVYCYFAKMTDKDGRHLTALRRATQFKGILKSRLIQLVTDALKIVEDKVFKLDTDFDLLIDDATVHVLRPSGLEFVGHLQEAVLAAVPENVQAIQADLKFVDFTEIEAYASKHPRAARYLAAIRALKEVKHVDKSALKRLCKETGVETLEVGGKIYVQDGHVIGFLEVLQRRRYQVELVKGAPERFRAASRSKIVG